MAYAEESVLNMKIYASSDWDQFFRCNVQYRFAFLCAHFSNSIRGVMYYIEISIVFCVFRAVNSNWIQIAQTSNDLPRQSIIDRSHFLASLNLDKDDFIVNTPHSMIDNFGEIQYNGYSDDIESKTKLFNHFTSTISTLRDPLTSNTTLDTIRISDLNLWPGDVSLENENVSQNIFSNTEMFFETTVPSLLNVTEIKIDSHSIWANSVTDKSNNKRLKTPTKYVLKRVELKPFDFPGVFGFLKEMQKTFLFRSFSAIDDKVKYLEKFKDNILSSIGECVKYHENATKFHRFDPFFFFLQINILNHCGHRPLK